MGEPVPLGAGDNPRYDVYPGTHGPYYVTRGNPNKNDIFSVYARSGSSKKDKSRSLGVTTAKEAVAKARDLDRSGELARLFAGGF